MQIYFFAHSHVFLIQGWHAVEPGADTFSAQGEVLERAEEKTGKHLVDKFHIISILLLPGKRSINSLARPGEGREHNKRAAD